MATANAGVSLVNLFFGKSRKATKRQIVGMFYILDYVHRNPAQALNTPYEQFLDPAVIRELKEQ
ncbi:MAG: hypothetical protein UY41_C0009G0041 [Candidatus Moranbacteria bacterium GW2011_GWE1_49_15]|nr:MAG: hypothetical protein UX75_C0029G0013 [Candidatus Moranbacteria bacterium GW2011_GWE2_47_10]KKW07102.1 MAG: hypothetical protein UY41_C0009G0041 [Candidatus Moranbacteria bacterium GW2011_GWE1_49_15]HBP01113.1 hypothetical protein [Candidatus Moranbacteria bacterium]